MNIYKKLSLIAVLYMFAQSALGGDNDPGSSASTVTHNRAMLIFLDDSEGDDAHIIDRKYGASTDQFIAAFSQEAGPILVSASLIANIKEREKPQETDPEKLLSRMQELMSQSDGPNDVTTMEYKRVVLSVVSFNKTTMQNWVIKKVNDALYLLIPKHYLLSMHIPEAAVQEYQPDSPLTTTELQLGLKVNHMPTITNVDDIQKPLPEPPIAYYFIDFVWDTKNNISTIFVINSEYQKVGSIAIPVWSLFIAGHGVMGATIAGLVFGQFKQFLHFLEYKINTTLLYYISCYAAGIAHKALYEDAESGIDKTYSFAIITQALTDAGIIIPINKFEIKEGKLVLIPQVSFTNFINNVTAADIIDYRTLDPYRSRMGISSFPQIKLPGLPWFSVIDDDWLCMIGSALAKARTRPLNIANFFARKGKKATPIGLLLYTHDIPFELIIDSKNMVGSPPLIISMIPGNALHHMKKISTTIYTVDDILQSFVGIKHLGPQKIFIIDSIQGIDSDGDTVVIQDVTIHLKPQQNSIYYLKAGKLLKVITKNGSEEGDAKDKVRHDQLLAIVNPAKTVISAEHMATLTAESTKTFAQKMIFTDMYTRIVDLLDTMPNDSIIHIPILNGISCPPDENCWYDLFYALSQYASFSVYKILWFDNLTIYNQKNQSMVMFSNIIVDVNKEKTEILCTNVHSKKMLIISSKNGMSEQKEPYISMYTDMFSYFSAHMKLPEKVMQEPIKIYDLLTQPAVSNIANVQEKKAHKVCKKRLKKKYSNCSVVK